MTFANKNGKDGTEMIICEGCKKNSDEVWISSLHHLCQECWWIKDEYK